jgi:hypothetical protein
MCPKCTVISALLMRGVITPDISIYALLEAAKKL